MTTKHWIALGVLVPLLGIVLGVASTFVDDRVELKTGPIQEAVSGLKAGQERIEKKLDDVLDRRR